MFLFIFLGTRKEKRYIETTIYIKIKQTNTKNRTFYVGNGMIKIENFDSNLLKIGKKSYKNIDIFYIGSITIKNISDYENVQSVNLFHLIIGKAGGYIEEKNENKYLTFASTDKNKY